MASAIDKFENAVGLAVTLLIGILVIWLYLRSKNEPDFGAGIQDALAALFKGKISGGDISTSENLSRWNDELFGTDEDRQSDADSTPWNVAQPAPATPEQIAQVQQAVSDYAAANEDPNADADVGDAVTNWVLNNRVF